MSYSTRPLDTDCLRGAAVYYADEFLKGSFKPSADGPFVGGRSFAMDQLFNVDFKDEFEFIVETMDQILADGDAAREWIDAKRKRFEPRRDDVFEDILARKLAIYPDGTHIPGKIGTVSMGQRIIGRSPHVFIAREKPRTLAERMGLRKPPIYFWHTRVQNDYWEVYAGEIAERVANPEGADHLDILPEGAQPFVEEMLATNPKMANVVAIAACNAIVDQFETLGSTAGTINGRTGTQPADVDATETGTLLFTLTLNLNDAFGSAADDTGKATATANAITDDTSADATGTLGYCRCASTGTGADNLLDGEAGTSASDFNFNTLSIVSGTNVSMSAFTVSVSE